MTDRYPDYDVLSKRSTQSWNEQTRQVVDARLLINPNDHRFLDEANWIVLQAVCARIVPQPSDRKDQAPIAAMVDQKLAQDERDGFRHTQLPPMQEAWTRGLAAIEAEARRAHDRGFADLTARQQDDLLTAIQAGDVKTQAWGEMPARLFFKARLLHDIVGAYYAHPLGWNEIGFGGPASPRGYVRMNFDRRDPWEAAEAHPGHEAEAREANRRVGR